MKKYERATPIGIWTGKVMIGGHYLPNPKAMSDNECFVQGLIRNRGLPPERAMQDVWLKIKSMFKGIRHD
jgi:hypothetical protein